MNIATVRKQRFFGVASLVLVVLSLWVPCIWWVAFGSGGVESPINMFDVPFITSIGAVMLGLLLCFFSISHRLWTAWASMVAAVILIGVVGFMIFSNLRGDQSAVAMAGFLWTIYLPLIAIALLQGWSACLKLRRKKRITPTNHCTRQKAALFGG